MLDSKLSQQMFDMPWELTHHHNSNHTPQPTSKVHVRVPLRWHKAYPGFSLGTETRFKVIVEMLKLMSLAVSEPLIDFGIHDRLKSCVSWVETLHFVNGFSFHRPSNGRVLAEEILWFGLKLQYHGWRGRIQVLFLQELLKWWWWPVRNGSDVFNAERSRRNDGCLDHQVWPTTQVDCFAFELQNLKWLWMLHCRLKLTQKR